jgi:exonuclease VII small subunit
MENMSAWALLASAKESLEDAEQKLSILAANAEKALTMVQELPTLIATR